MPAFSANEKEEEFNKSLLTAKHNDRLTRILNKLKKGEAREKRSKAPSDKF